MFYVASIIVSLVSIHVPLTDVSGGDLVNVPGPGCHLGLKLLI